MEFTVVIPARYHSSRLPAKPLADIAGKPMIQWVYEQAIQSLAKQVIIATDDERIEHVALGFGATVCMTSKAHTSGTERLAEVIKKMRIGADEIVVNVQGDEPLIPFEIITQVAQNLAESSAPMSTLAVELSDSKELFNPNVVKVIRDVQKNALYFSRAAIPWDRDRFAQSQTPEVTAALRHIGLYAYRAGFVDKYIGWQPSPLEQIESLEQLRVLWYGEKIHVDIALKEPPTGVDTLEDLEAVRRLVGGFCA